MGVLKNMVWKFSSLTFRHILLSNVDIEAKGLENLPNGGAVLAANHNHLWDPIVLVPLVYKRKNKKIHTFAQYKTWISPFKSTILRKIEKKLLGKNLTEFYAGDMMEQIPVCAGMKELNRRAYKKASCYLKKGDFVAVFPEGDIKDRKKNQLYSGVARTAVSNRVPIIPIYIWNDGKKDTLSIKRDFKRYKIVVGKPITNFLEGEFKTKTQFRALSKKVLGEIYRLRYAK